MAELPQTVYACASLGTPFTYSVRTTRRTKRLRISVYPGGRVVLSVPSYASSSVTQDFLSQHAMWVRDTVLRLKDVKERAPRLQGRRATYLKERESARALVRERLHYWNQHYGLPYKRIAIKNMSTRWGSCSARGNLNFHYRVGELPERLADYLIVHELCHIKEMNHGPRFWALVSETIPDYEERRSELRRWRPLSTPAG